MRTPIPTERAKRLPAQADLLRALDYNPLTGSLTHRERTEVAGDKRVGLDHPGRGNKMCAGKPAFTNIGRRGYFSGRVLGEQYLAHRIIWKMMTGADPDCIDHINGDPVDNRWANLRATTAQGNNRNKRLAKNNSSGVCGVYRWTSPKGAVRWRARIVIDSRCRYLGSFRTPSEAVEARKAASDSLGFSERHGA